MEGASPAEYNAEVVEEFRTRGGHVSGPLADTPLMLVHHVGAVSGVERVVPLVYHAQPDGRFFVIASNGGSPSHPSWYYNLKANPSVTVEVGSETFRAVAHELDAATRSLVWPTIIEQAPAAGRFQAMTTRKIPVFILSREPHAPGEPCDTC